MSAYIVRVVGENDLVGLFVVPRLEDLFWAVDECCDPSLCEYVPTRKASIFFTGYSPYLDDEMNHEKTVDFTPELGGRFFEDTYEANWKPVPNKPK